MEDESYFTLYYNPEIRGNVDFIIQREFQKAIPIEVNMGKKLKNRYLQQLNATMQIME